MGSTPQATRKPGASSKQSLIMQYLSSFNFGTFYLGSTMRSLQPILAGNQRYQAVNSPSSKPAAE